MWQSLKNIYHLIIAFMANVWFSWPSKKLKVIGVTGTDGKTTTASLIYHILKTAGLNVSLITSIGAFIGGKEYDVGFHVTTPSPFALQRFLKKAAGEAGPAARSSQGARASLSFGTERTARLENSPLASPASVTLHFLVLEVTSHAIDQYRVWGIPFVIGVLTNISHEHLDYHKTYENYVKTKARLLQMARVAILNRDDESYQTILHLKSKILNLTTYGLKKSADVNPQTFSFKTNLMGEFNRYNCLAAVAACQALGIDDSLIRKGLQTFRLPIGRAEIVHDGSFTVMIDFAHTPNALEQILSSLKPKVLGRLIHVFGSAGKRDYAKRPKMGAVSSKYADIIILTAEDPRGESVEKIIKEIASGIDDRGWKVENGSRGWKLEGRKLLLKISDRREAITEAIKMAKRGDLVLITGKGHEKSMNYGNGEVPWSEHGAVATALHMANSK